MNIDFTSQVYECGKTGEHNANSVTVTIPNSMVHTGSLYRLAFWGMSNCNSIRTDALTVVDGKVTYNLPYEITSLVEAKMTLEEYVENELVRKSEMVTIKFAEAVPDGEEGVTGETPVMLEIQQNTEARHTHLNYDTLADFSESATGDLFFNDKLYYNADRVDYEIEQAIEQSDGDLIEIVSSGSTSNYKATELRNMGNNGKSFSYNGTPVVAWTWINNMFRFKYIAMNSNSTVCFRIKAVSEAKAIINYAADEYPVISVNTKTGTGITLDASDIVAPSGWTPPANNSLATKKYVDDHASVSTWDGIEGKPSTFPPSAHTHTVSQITDYSPYDDTAIKGRVEVIEGKEAGWDAKQNAITPTNKLDYSLIANTPTIPTVPTNISAFTNDSGYALVSEIPTDLPNPNALTITQNGTSVVYDGSEAKSITITGGGSGDYLPKSSSAEYIATRMLSVETGSAGSETTYYYVDGSSLSDTDDDLGEISLDYIEISGNPEAHYIWLLNASANGILWTDLDEEQHEIRATTDGQCIIHLYGTEDSAIVELLSASDILPTTTTVEQMIAESPHPIDYSTEEQDTGMKWIDGKTIYQTTVVIDIPNGNTEASADVSSLNISMCIGLDGIAHINQYGDLFWQLSRYSGSNSYWAILYDGDQKKIRFAHYTGSGKAYVTVKYTKNS